MGCGVSSHAPSSGAGGSTDHGSLAPLAAFFAANTTVKRLVRGSSSDYIVFLCPALDAGKQHNETGRFGTRGSNYRHGYAPPQVLVRHANAAPRDAAATAAEFGLDAADLPKHANAWTASDLSRPLTEKGKKQATDAAADWAKTYALVALITSEAVRARETLVIIAPEPTHSSIKILPALHPAKCNAPLCEKMFDTMGYGPLAKFWRNAEGLCADNESTPIDGASAFTDYAADCLCGGGKTTFLSLLQAMLKRADAQGDTIMVTGHAVFLNAVALGIAQACGATKTQQQELLDLDLGEAQGIELVRSGDSRGIASISLMAV